MHTCMFMIIDNVLFCFYNIYTNIINMFTRICLHVFFITILLILLYTIMRNKVLFDLI